MKKLVFTLIAFVALMGFLNCVLIEPALHFQEGSSVSQVDKTHGCVICQSGHHQWTAPEASMVVSNTPSFGFKIPLSVDLNKDLFPASIFHPPHSI